MRYFSFNEFDHKSESVTTVSEDDVRREYYPYWYEKMCAKYGKEHVDENYCFEDCLCDWVTVHWAWSSL